MSFVKLYFIGLWVNYCPLCLLSSFIKKWDISIVPFKFRVIIGSFNKHKGYSSHVNIKEGVLQCFCQTNMVNQTFIVDWLQGNPLTHFFMLAKHIFRVMLGSLFLRYSYLV